MPGHKNTDSRYYLNRVAMETDDDPLTINPYPIMKPFFEYDDVEGIIGVFRFSCEAALTETYSWKNDTAANLVSFYERLELLVETCYLITLNEQHKKTASAAVSNAKKPALPCPLTQDELNNPYLIIEQFFALHNLAKWKKLLHCFMEAGISRFSVVDNIKIKELLTYCQYMEKLIYVTSLFEAVE
jgi:hypothetical protein